MTALALARSPMQIVCNVTMVGASIESQYVHLYAYGSYLGCLTANRWLGQG
jgi:hypothetical protein